MILHGVQSSSTEEFESPSNVSFAIASALSRALLFDLAGCPPQCYGTPRVENYMANTNFAINTHTGSQDPHH